MLQLYRTAVLSVDMPKIVKSQPIAIAFGSFGRLDGDPGVSDYDVLYVYRGRHNKRATQGIRSLIRQIVSDNQALRFDHRNPIEDGTFDFDASPAYPILSTHELLRDNGVRALHTITEGRAVVNREEFVELRDELIRSLGYTDVVHAVDFGKLRAALADYRSSYCSGVYAQLRRSGTTFANRKILKLFSLREFFYLATLLSVAELALGVATTTFSSQRACQTLSAPCVLRVASLLDSSAPLCSLCATAPDSGAQLCEIFTRHIERLPNGDAQTPAVSTEPSSTENRVQSHLRPIVNAVLSNYSALLEMLHDEEFLRIIDSQSSSVVTWMHRWEFQLILRYRRDLILTTKILAEAMLDVLDHFRKNHAIKDAAISLNAIASYSDNHWELD